MKDLFFEFLKKQGVSAKEYKRCFEDDKFTGEQTFEEFLNYEPNIPSYVGGAFKWNCSTIGVVKMRELGELWDEILKEKGVI